MKLFEEVAVAFADALVGGDFGGARDLLAPTLRTCLIESGLREQLQGMHRAYSDNEPTSAELVPDGSLETWPGKLPGDLGLAYVSITGADFNEAVYVLVSEIDGQPVIREIEWGRP